MSSFISQHKARWGKTGDGTTATAAKATVTPPASTLPSNTEIPDDAIENFGLWVASAKMDWDRLKAIKEHATRNLHKPELLEKYRPIMDAYIEAEATHDNPILGILIIWATDVADWATVLRYADIAAKNQQATILIKRDLWTFATDSMLQAEGDIPFAELLQRIESGDWGVNWPLEAKVYKRAGLLAQKDGDPAEALKWFELANETYENVGVKRKIEALKSQLASGEKPADTEKDSGPQTGENGSSPQSGGTGEDSGESSEDGTGVVGTVLSET